jgi:hypothetical protein
MVPQGTIRPGRLNRQYVHCRQAMHMFLFLLILYLTLILKVSVWYYHLVSIWYYQISIAD